ncbi:MULTISPECIES: diacylglycerol kinase [unclassified Saccharopolyspora]|uniref:diacylglycerol kinase n=1 Tax=unclassified Saccharopolyspora TaxID=2646250 RepID=UPI001CD243F7|nr:MULTISPECIES: diacylglycerol kinase [unclassified Saccharopolyspora]MCA1190085.1 diacylglycerol kinase [Saccharopolyspora sp. 6T]MCA1279790.1 diacylglycerol kinase [Saccharopolyspora sp. 7B]
MIDEVALLVNPRSGQGGGAATAVRALRFLRAAGVSVRVLVGRDATEAQALAHRAVGAGTGALVACGGDGIVNLALQAVAGTGTPFAVIPSGTGNDHARMLGVPRHDPIAAARVLLDGVARPIDLGRAGDRWFGTVFAGGFDAKVTERTNRLRWPRGKLRYNLALVAELAALRPLHYELELDGERVSTSGVLVAVGNGASYGGGMRVCPGAVPDDGLFDVTVLGAVPLARLVRLLPRIYPGTHVARPEVTTYRARRVRLSAPDVVGYADGERFAPLPLVCECVPRAATALVPS